MESLNAIRRAVRAKLAWEPARPQPQRDANTPKTDIQRSVCDKLKQLRDSAGETMPHVSLRSPHQPGPNGNRETRALILIPNAMYSSKRDIWEDMVRTGQLPNISYEYFILLWDRYHWNVQVKSWNPFAKCDTCVNMRFRWLNAKTDEERDQVAAERQLHRGMVTYFRDRTTKLMQLPITNPDLFLFVVMDGMDSKKTQVPWLRSDAIFSKDLDQAGKTLDTRLVGMHVPGYGFYGWWVEPLFKQGGSGTCTLLHRLLSDILSQHGRLPRVLLLMLDNTVKENKNNTVVQYLSFLVHCQVFDRVLLVFLPVGHTHSVIDQRFSVIHRELSTTDAFTLDDLVNAVQALKLKDGKTKVQFNQQKVVRQALDFGWLTQFAHTFKGFQTTRINGEKHTAHSIQLSHTAAGVVFQYKDLDVPGDWQGHVVTNEALPVFKAPPVPPTTTAVLPRRQIKMQPVQEKVHAMFEFIGVSDNASQPSTSAAAGSASHSHVAAWWNAYFTRESGFWSSRNPASSSAGVVEADQSVDAADEHLTSWLPLLRGNPWRQSSDGGATARAVQLLREHDELPVPEGLQVPAQERWIGRKGVVGDLLQSVEAFDPTVDLSEGMIALILVDKEASTLKRGWEMALVTGLREGMGVKEFDGFYLCPKVPGRRHGFAADAEDWPTGWEQLPLVPLMQQRRVWDFVGMDVDFVQWATEPARGKRASGKSWSIKPAERVLLRRNIDMCVEAAEKLAEASAAAATASAEERRQRACIARQSRVSVNSSAYDTGADDEDDGASGDESSDSGPE